MLVIVESVYGFLANDTASWMSRGQQVGHQGTNASIDMPRLRANKAAYFWLWKPKIQNSSLTKGEYLKQIITIFTGEQLSSP